MTGRIGTVLRAPVAVGVAAALIGFSVAACSSEPTNPAPGPSVGQELHRTLPASLSRIRFTDSAGRQLTLAALRGKVVVISDMLTLCQGTCPVDTAQLAAAARQVRAAGVGDRVAFLSITLDPGRDDPARLAAYRRQYSPAPPDWSALTAAPADLARLWRLLGVYRQTVTDKPPLPRDWLTHRKLTYDVTHSDEVFFLDTTGRERFVLQGAPHITPGLKIPPRLKTFMAAGDERHDDPDPQAWTSAQAVQVIGWLLDKKL